MNNMTALFWQAAMTVRSAISLLYFVAAGLQTSGLYSAIYPVASATRTLK